MMEHVGAQYHTDIGTAAGQYMQALRIIEWLMDIGDLDGDSTYGLERLGYWYAKRYGGTWLAEEIVGGAVTRRYAADNPLSAVYKLASAITSNADSPDPYAMDEDADRTDIVRPIDAMRVLHGFIQAHDNVLMLTQKESKIVRDNYQRRIAMTDAGGHITLQALPPRRRV
jgi:hypothetical protein